MTKKSAMFLVLLVMVAWTFLPIVPAMAVPPEPPPEMYVVSMSSTMVALGWTASTGETSYQVSRLDPGATEFVYMPVMGADTYNYVDSLLTPGATYQYYVYASNADGSVHNSSPLVVTMPAAGAPATPVNLNVAGLTSSSVTLEWEDWAGDETRYFVERRSSSSAAWTEVHSALADLESFTDSSVTPGETYSYRVFCTSPTGYSENSNEVSATIPDIGTPPAASLAAPDNLHLVAASSARVDIAWNDNAAGDTAYYVQRAEPGVSVYADIATLPADAESYTDTSVIAGRTYNYEVYCGNSSVTSFSSNELTVVVPATTGPPADGIPAAPSNLLVTGVSTSGIDLIWTSNSSNETGFIIERRAPGEADFSLYDSLPAGTEAYTDTGFGVPFQPGETYYYRVEAINAAGYSAFSNQATAVIPASGTSVLSFFIYSNIYYVNGAPVTMDVEAMATENRTLLPIRYVVEPLGGTAIWDGADQKATVYLNHHIVELWVGNNTARVDGSDIMIDPSNPNVMPLAIPPGRIMMPLRFIGESTGCLVDWFPDTNEARVTFTPTN